MNTILRYIYLFGTGCFAPVIFNPALAQLVVTGSSPTANLRNAPRSTNVSVGFSQNLGAGSTNALRVFSNQRGGLRTASSGITAVNGNALLFTPSYAFWPGETVTATVTAAAQTSNGTALAKPHVFQFTAAAGASGSGTFAGGSDVPVGGAPYIVATADVDNDGDLDLVTPNFYSSTVSIRLNNGAGIFSNGSDPSVGSQPRGVVMADLDGDGDLDFATSNYNANTVSVRLNNGAGIFSGTTELPVGSRPQSIVAADLDGDGDLDLLSSNEVGATVSIRINNGNATFSARPDVLVSSFPFSITIADVDSDGDIDLIAGNYSSSTVSIRLNDGSGTLTAGYDVNVGSSPRGVSMADVDGDGDLDLLAANAGNNSVSVRLNNGTGLFSGTQSVSVGSFPGSVTTGDVDGDGDLDLLTTNISSNTVSVRRNNGAGIFSGTTDIPVGSDPYRVAMADLDGDGDLDLLTANFGANTVSVRFNQAPPARVSIAGDSVVCNGGRVQLTATAPAPISSYSWSTGATSQSIFVTSPGTYGVTATFADGRTSFAQHTVRAINPTVQILGDTLLCGNGSVPLQAVFSSGASLRWSTGATTPSINVTQAGIYTVTASWGAGCSVTVQAAVRAPFIRISGLPILCANSSAPTLLTAVAPGAIAIRWNTGVTTSALLVNQAGAYSAVATFANGCTLTASQAVTVPVATISGDSLLCANRSIQLTAALSGAVPGTFRWNTGATTAAISVTQPGIYAATITYGNGCSSQVQQRVRGIALIPVFTLGADTTACESAGNAVILRLPAMLETGISYRWSDGSVGPTLRVTQSGTYSLVLTTACDRKTFSRRITFEPCLKIPNIITANEDGKNDRFRIQGLSNGAWMLEVYSRWGEKIFETRAYQNDWGYMAAPGVYYYVLRRLDTSSTSIKGWVEVLR
jgi:hypothetical protein